MADEGDTPHDQIFKRLLQSDFEKFIRIFYPKIAEHVDFNQHEFLDKEAFTDIPRGYQRESDVVVKVQEKDGDQQLFLFLVEIEDREGRTRPPPGTKLKQADPESDSDERAEPQPCSADETMTGTGEAPFSAHAQGQKEEMIEGTAETDTDDSDVPADEDEAPRVPIGERLLVYYAALWSRYRLQIVPIVLYLFHAKRGMRRVSYQHRVAGQTFLDLRYLTIGLPRLSAHRYLMKGGALTGALAALMKRERWSRARLKAECLRVIGISDDTQALKFLALDCVETYLRLKEIEQRRFETMIREETYMEAQRIQRTWADEQRDRWLREGRQEILFTQLQIKFGPLAPKVETRIRQMKDKADLDRLAERILTADSLEAMGLRD